jgi:hypothetical protein
MIDYKTDDTHELRLVPEDLRPRYDDLKSQMEKKYGSDFEWKQVGSAEELLDFVAAGEITAIVAHGSNGAFAINLSSQKEIVDAVPFSELNDVTPKGGKTLLSTCYSLLNLKKAPGRYPNLEGNSEAKTDVGLLIKQAMDFIDDQYKLHEKH